MIGRRAIFVVAVSGSLASGAYGRTGGDFYIFHGPGSSLAKLVAAARDCNVDNVEKAVGNHLEPTVWIPVPKAGSRQETCLRAWLDDNQKLGLDNDPSLHR